VLRLGFEPKRAKTASSGYQEALAFTQDQVSQIVKARTAFDTANQNPHWSSL